MAAQDEQTLVVLAGLAEMQLPTEENFLAVPSTQAAVDHLTNSANGRDAEDENLVAALAVDIKSDGKACHQR